MLADLRYALRSFSRAPWYSATVVGVIALGMALSTTVFAVVDGVLFKPLPYPQADRLVAIEPGFNNLPAPASPSASGAGRVRACWTLPIGRLRHRMRSSQASGHSAYRGWARV